MIRLTFYAVFSTLLVQNTSFASMELADLAKEVDVVWSSSDGVKMEIYYSQREGGVWKEPVMVTDDHYDNMYPVIDRDSSGRRWLFWTAYDRGTTEIHYTTGEGGEWQPSEIMVSDMATNISPSAVIDQQDRVWLVWSANDGQLDDIMYAYFHSNEWSDPEPVHDPNELPDLLPVVEVDGDGTPMVVWRASRAGQNVTLSSKFIDNDWTEPLIEEVESEQVNEDQADILELPEFINPGSMLFVRVY